MDTAPTVVSWPGCPPTADPWDDGCWPSFDEERRFGPLWAAWDGWRTGSSPLSELETAAREAGVDGPVLPDRNKPVWGLPIPEVADLCRLTLDYWPAAGVDAPDLVLGPASLFASLALRQVAVAGCAFVRTHGWAHHAFHLWCRDRPIPSVELRASLHAVELAPWALWEVLDRLPDGRLVLGDRTGLGPQYLPEGPVRVMGSLPVEGALAARVLRGPEGWVAHTVVPLDGLPSPAVVEQWITHESWLARTFQPGVTRESLLRKRPVLVRRALELGCFGQSPPQARGAGVTSAP